MFIFLLICTVFEKNKIFLTFLKMILVVSVAKVIMKIIEIKKLFFFVKTNFFGLKAEN